MADTIARSAPPWSAPSLAHRRAEKMLGPVRIYILREAFQRLRNTPFKSTKRRDALLKKVVARLVAFARDLEEEAGFGGIAITLRRLASKEIPAVARLVAENEEHALFVNDLGRENVTAGPDHIRTQAVRIALSDFELARKALGSGLAAEVTPTGLAYFAIGEGLDPAAGSEERFREGNVKNWRDVLKAAGTRPGGTPSE